MDQNVDLSPVEREAMEYGWAPEDQFKGPKEKWRPAEDYLGWAKTSGRLPKGEFENLKKEFPVIKQQNQQLQTQLGEIQETLKQFSEFSSKAEERAYERAKAELKAKAEQAAANADPAAARAAMDELDALKPPAPKPEPRQQQQAPAVDPEIQSWIQRTTWFNRDNSLRAYATEKYGELERSKPGMSAAELLAETERLTKEKFPEKFGMAERERPASVATPSGQAVPSRRPGKKTYADLPADAKAACDRFVKTIPGYTQEKYVAQYDWDN